MLGHWLHGPIQSPESRRGSGRWLPAARVAGSGGREAMAPAEVGADGKRAGNKQSGVFVADLLRLQHIQQDIQDRSAEEESGQGDLGLGDRH